MQLEILKINNVLIGHITSREQIINTPQEALDLMMNCYYQGANNLISYENNFTPAFYKLNTGIAGEILQKFSNYNMKLAIVGNFTNLTSKSLNDFILESNNVGRVNFVASYDEAIEVLVKIE